MRAMILLAVNGGLGNTDGAMPKALDLRGKWLDYPRGKTGVSRRVPSGSKPFERSRRRLPHDRRRKTQRTPTWFS